MNYKDKAHELFDKYIDAIPANQETDINKFIALDRQTAKQCAIIACDSIIEAIENFDYSDTLVNYYEKVKQAINEL